MIEMTVDSVRINLATQQRVVILKAKEMQRFLFIWIAQAEAYSIAVHLQGTTSPRPLSHDLMKSLLESTGAKIMRVEITDITDEIFYAHIVLDVAGKTVNVDARPSDAFALAVRANAPIYVAESVLEKSGVVVDSEGKSDAPQATEPIEKETVAEATPPSPLTQLARERDTLKEQLALAQEELRQAQEHIKELES